MKYKYIESGVEWLGKIPEHWSVTKIKTHFAVMPSNVDKKTNEGETAVKLCNYVDVYYNENITADIDFMLASANEHEIRKFTLLQNDVLITKDSEDPHDIAVAAIVKHTEKNLLCGYHLSMLRSKSGKYDANFLFWVLKDAAIISQLHREACGVTRWAIASRHIKNSIIPQPAIEEQAAIAAYLASACAKLDRIIGLKGKATEDSIVHQQTEKLSEYRKSLIHECVTGKKQVF